MERIVDVRGLKTRARHPVLKAVLISAVVAMFLGAAYVGVRVFERWLSDAIPPSPTAPTGEAGIVFQIRTKAGTDERVFSLNLDREVWSADKDLKARLKSNAAFKRADDEADAWLSIAVQDFGVRNPREVVLLKTAVERLQAIFGDSLQFNAHLEDAKFSGIDCRRTTFRGRIGAVQWNGEAYLIAHQGFAYCVLVAAPTLEEAQRQIAELDSSRRIQIVTDRRGWTEQPPEFETYVSTDGAFAVHTPERIWNKNDPKSEDDRAVLYLSGHFESLGTPGTAGGITKNATLVAVALDKTTELTQAFAEARKYFERRKREESKEYEYVPTEAKSRFDGEPADIGTFPGTVGEMKLQRGATSSRYVLLAVFNEGPKSYGLRFECAWEMRDVWRKEFHDVIQSVRLAPK